MIKFNGQRLLFLAFLYKRFEDKEFNSTELKKTIRKFVNFLDNNRDYPDFVGVKGKPFFLPDSTFILKVINDKNPLIKRLRKGCVAKGKKPYITAIYQFTRRPKVPIKWLEKIPEIR